MSDNPGEPEGIPFERAIRLIERGTLREPQGLIPWSSNYTFLLSIHDEELETLVVYKPRRGERPLWDFREGTLCLRERAAFLVSEALGWRIVPPTALRDGPLGFGSVQLFIPHDPEVHYFTLGPESRLEFRPQLMRIALFDHVVNNADRKAGHCLVDRARQVWAIDHGICFHALPKLRTVIREFAGEKIPDRLLADLRRLCDQIGEEGDSSELRQELGELLSPREMEALLRRTEDLIRAGIYPQIGDDTGYPWPPI